MSTPTPFRPACDETDELVIERHAREPAVWIVHHRETRLIVGTAPWSRARVLLSRSEFQHPSCYALVGDTDVLQDGRGVAGTHIGRTGRPPARARQHRHAPPLAGMSTLTVISLDSGRGLLLEEAAALEQALHEAAAAAGSHQVVSRAPRDRGLSPGVVTRVQRWLDTLRWMLPVARCDILEAGRRAAPRPGARAEPEPEAAGLPPSMGWTTRLPQGLLARADVRRFRLERGEIRATALVVDGWCILEEGSHARAGEIASLQAGLRNKRHALRRAGILEPVPGRQDLWVATARVGVPSLTNLTRLILGNNARHQVWQQVP
ncbi:hypothetical protein ACFOYU_18585 [Microvirga sp. GCM10011540]|uniref:hypothetical protein n=1 Tax=Microvirga sp. GCM10011540 TaxID=3317338 RepID=UPI0036066163